MSSEISVSAQALSAFDTSLSATAHNIANSSTEGYHSQSVALADGPGGEGVHVSGVSTAQAPGVDLTREVTGLMQTSRAFEANATFIRAAEETTGHVLNMIA